MGKRDKLSIVFCPRCNGTHPEGEHLAKPKRAPKLVQITPANMHTILKADRDQMEKSEAEILNGVALVSTAHPRGRKKAPPADISPSSIETIEAPASVAAEIERLGPKGIAKRKADRRKRKKEEEDGTSAHVVALDDRTAVKIIDDLDAELARQRSLRAARQARYRAKLKKPKRKKKRKAKK